MNQVVLVDEKDNIIGQTSLQEAHEKGLLHRVSIIYLFNDKGQILIQHRADGRLDHSSAGHVDPGESYLIAARRELEEELGAKDVTLEEFGETLNEELKPDGDYIKHKCVLYKVKANPVTINTEEIQSVYWEDPKIVYRDMQKDPNNIKYTNGFKISIKVYLNQL